MPRKTQHRAPAPHSRRAAGLIILLLTPAVLSAQQTLLDTTVVAHDGVRLDARIALPGGPPPAGGFPGIVLIHGFGGTKEDMGDFQFVMALSGYASIAYSVRGQGNSGGLAEVVSEVEKNDLLAMIDFFGHLPQVNPALLGVTGGSQGGIHSWMAAVHQMPGVRAVAPVMATPDFALSLVPGGCIRTALPLELTLASVRYSPERDRARDFIIADQYDSVRSYAAVRDLSRLLPRVAIPVLQGVGWDDTVFPANGAIHARDSLASRHVPIHTWLGTNGHGIPLDPTEFAALAGKILGWFDHWLKGKPLEDDSLARVYYADHRDASSQQITTVWPPVSAYRGIQYLTPGGLSETSPVSSAPTSWSFSLDYDTSYTPVQGWDDLYSGTGFTDAFQSSPSWFFSPPLTESAEITGIPTGTVYVEGEGEKFQVHVRIYDIADDTLGESWTLISRSVNAVRKNTPGEIHEITFEASAISHLIPLGHRLGIEITSLDMQDESRAHTIPVFASTRATVLSSAGHPSYVRFGQEPLTAVAEHAGARFPTGFALEQNFPNPFNPATTIAYQIPQRTHVTLSVFTILGQEVVRLVDREQGPGQMRVSFEAGGLASGVYLYRLQAGSHVSVRRMTLIR